MNDYLWPLVVLALGGGALGLAFYIFREKEDVGALRALLVRKANAEDVAELEQAFMAEASQRKELLEMVNRIDIRTRPHQSGALSVRR